MHPYIVMVRTDIRSDILFTIPDNPNNLNLQSSGTNDAPRYPLNTPVTLVLRVLRHIQDDCAVATITPQQRRPYPPPQYKEGYFSRLATPHPHFHARGSTESPFLCACRVQECTLI